MQEQQQMGSRVLIEDYFSRTPSRIWGRMDKLEVKKISSRNLVKSSQSQVMVLSTNTKPSVSTRIADTKKSVMDSALGQKYSQVRSAPSPVTPSPAAAKIFITHTYTRQMQMRQTSLFIMLTKHSLIFSTLILLKRGQKHSDTLKVLHANMAKGSSLAILQSTPNTNTMLLSYILH